MVIHNLNGHFKLTPIIHKTSDVFFLNVYFCYDKDVQIKNLCPTKATVWQNCPLFP